MTGGLLMGPWISSSLLNYAQVLHMCSAELASLSRYANGIMPCFLFHDLNLNNTLLSGWNIKILVLAPKVTPDTENVNVSAQRGDPVGYIEIICSFRSAFSAVWNDSSSYPTSWQLDATEGPNRERRRLQRCYLTIPNKYLLRDRRKPEGEGAF